MSEMSDDELTTAEAKPLSPLQIFFVKVAIITAAIIAVLYCASYFFESFIASQISFFDDLDSSPAPTRPAAVAVPASMSNGWRKVVTTSPPSQVQFDSTKLSRRRFSRGSCVENSR